MNFESVRKALGPLSYFFRDLPDFNVFTPARFSNGFVEVDNGSQAGQIKLEGGDLSVFTVPARLLLEAIQTVEKGDLMLAKDGLRWSSGGTKGIIKTIEFQDRPVVETPSEDLINLPDGATDALSWIGSSPAGAIYAGVHISSFHGQLALSSLSSGFLYAIVFPTVEFNREDIYSVPEPFMRAAAQLDRPLGLRLGTNSVWFEAVDGSAKLSTAKLASPKQAELREIFSRIDLEPTQILQVTEDLRKFAVQAVSLAEIVKRKSDGEYIVLKKEGDALTFECTLPVAEIKHSLAAPDFKFERSLKLKAADLRREIAPSASFRATNWGGMLSFLQPSAGAPLMQIFGQLGECFCVSVIACEVA